MITPDVPGILGVTADPRVAHPSPLKKNAEKDIWWSKMELCSTRLPPPTGLTLPVWNTGVRLVHIWIWETKPKLFLSRNYLLNCWTSEYFSFLSLSEASRKSL